MQIERGLLIDLAVQHVQNGLAQSDRDLTVGLVGMMHGNSRICQLVASLNLFVATPVSANSHPLCIYQQVRS